MTTTKKQPGAPIHGPRDDSMTLRDYFAGQALASIDASEWSILDFDQAKAALAYTVADAMIKERGK